MGRGGHGRRHAEAVIGGARRQRPAAGGTQRPRPAVGGGGNADGLTIFCFFYSINRGVSSEVVTLARL